MGWNPVAGRGRCGGGVVRRRVEDPECGAGDGVHPCDRGLGGVGVGESRTGGGAEEERGKLTSQRASIEGQKEEDISERTIKGEWKKIDWTGQGVPGKISSA